MKKRDFLKNMSMLSVGLPLSLTNLDNLVTDYKHLPANQLAADEDFWLKVRGG